MSQRFILDQEYIKEIPSEGGDGIVVPAAAAGVDGSVMVCTATAELGYAAFITQIANIPDETDAEPYIYFRVKINGAWAQGAPFNKFASCLGTPNQPGNFRERVTQGAVVELWTFNTDTTATHPVTGRLLIGLQEV